MNHLNSPVDVESLLGFTKATHPSAPVDPEEREFFVESYGTIPLVSKRCRVMDARALVPPPSLDRQGFTLLTHRTAYANERDPEVMRTAYLDEMAEFLHRHFDASWVVPLREGTYFRQSGNKPTTKDGVRLPAGYAHMDFTRDSSVYLAELENKRRGLPHRDFSRRMLIQTWRALSPPPQDFPLAVCDSTSLSPTDYFAKSVGRLSIGEQADTYKSQAVHFNPNQRWYYYPNMRPDEVLVFKSYDSIEEMSTKVPHCAFDNMAAFPDAVPRESIESRYFVYFA